MVVQGEAAGRLHLDLGGRMENGFYGLGRKACRVIFVNSALSFRWSKLIAYLGLVERSGLPHATVAC